MTEHTPTPRLRHEFQSGRHFLWAEGEELPMASYPDEKGRTHFFEAIVKACNAHDGLVNVLGKFMARAERRSMKAGDMKIYTEDEIDKSGWGDGPWQDEPDKKAWVDETGLHCLVVRGPFGGLCGYVGVPPSHSLHGKRYDDTVQRTAQTDEMLNRPVGTMSPINLLCAGVDGDGNISLSLLFDCHGGLTYAGKGGGVIAADGAPESVWWFGFDHTHSGDYSPKNYGSLGPDFAEGTETGGVYRDMAYAQGQVTGLAKQIFGMAGKAMTEQDVFERDDDQDPAELALMRAVRTVQERAIAGKPMEQATLLEAFRLLEEILG